MMRRLPSLTALETREIRHALGFHFNEQHPDCRRELTIQADAIEVIVTRMLARREFAAEAQDLLATLDGEA